MSDKSAIEWTDATWNPVTGCDQVSPGCDHCYAMTMAPRLKAMGNPSYQTDGTRKTSGPGFGVALHPEMLDKPLRWKRPRRVFVNSMSDLFHGDVPDEFIARIFAVMALAGQHQFQVLTKRPRRMAHLLNDDQFQEAWFWLRHEVAVEWGGSDLAVEWPPPNVWLGVSVENQEWADKRIPLLLETPAAVRFLSCEPLIGPVDLDDVSVPVFSYMTGDHSAEVDDTLYLQPGVDWVIVGGESGPGARPMHPDWARSLRDQCVAAGVPFFFKQWGAWLPDGNSETAKEGFVSMDGQLHTEQEDTRRSHRPEYVVKVGKKRAGRELDGRTWDEMPTMERVG